MGKLRARACAVLAIVMVAGLFASASGSAAPIEYSTTPLTTGWSTNGTVLAVQVVGDTVYAGGAFTSVRPSSGGASVARSNLAAFDVHTGALLRSEEHTSELQSLMRNPFAV